MIPGIDVEIAKIVGDGVEEINVFYDEDIEKIEKEYKEELLVCNYWEPSHTRWQINKETLISKLLNCDKNRLKWIRIPNPKVVDKEQIFIEHSYKLTIRKTGVLTSIWTGMDFGDYEHYFVTTPEDWEGSV